jgi:hypothetical protein
VERFERLRSRVTGEPAERERIVSREAVDRGVVRSWNDRVRPLTIERVRSDRLVTGERVPDGDRRVIDERFGTTVFFELSRLRICEVRLDRPSTLDDRRAVVGGRITCGLLMRERAPGESDDRERSPVTDRLGVA